MLRLGLALVVLLATGCAWLKSTERLPSPSPSQGIEGGPEGEPEYIE